MKGAHGTVVVERGTKGYKGFSNDGQEYSKGTRGSSMMERGTGGAHGTAMVERGTAGVQQCYCSWSLLHSAILCCPADSLRLHVILHR